MSITGIPRIRTAVRSHGVIVNKNFQGKETPKNLEK